MECTYLKPTTNHSLFFFWPLKRVVGNWRILGG